MSTLLLASAVSLLAHSPVAASPCAHASYWSLDSSPLVANWPSVAQSGEEQAARRFSYDYLEAELSLGTYSGFSLAGSYGLTESLYGIAQVQSLGDDEFGVSSDLLAVSAGASYVKEINDDLDLIATGALEYGSLKVSVGPFSASDSEFGFVLGGGARYAINSQLEAFGGLGVRTIYDYGVSLDGGVRYQFSEDLAVQASLDIGDETFFTFGVRYSM